MNNHSLKDWILATRPWSFPASTMPVVVITAYAAWLSSTDALPGIHADWINGLLAFLTMMLFQATGNVWSDLNDYKSGVDTAESYGVDILTSGKFTTGEIRGLAAGLFLATIITGAILLSRSGPLAIALGIAGILLTVFYPQLKYNALGDLDIFLTYGILPTIGTGYVLTGEIMPSTLFLAVPIGLITVAILHINNTRDSRTDAKAGIRTFAMLIGFRASSIIYIGEILIPFAIIGILAITGQLPAPTLLTLVAILPAIANVKAMKNAKAGNMSSILSLDARTAQLQLAFSMLLSISLIVSSVCGI